MATVREGVMPLLDPDTSRTGEVIREDIAIEPADLPLKLVERHVQERTVNLKSARVIAAGGGGALTNISGKEPIQAVVFDVKGLFFDFSLRGGKFSSWTHQN